MFERVIAGLLIGFVAGFIESGLLPLSQKTQWTTEGVMVLVAIGFVVSSFMYGPAFGVAAIVEIVIGYSSASKVFRSRKAQP